MKTLLIVVAVLLTVLPASSGAQSGTFRSNIWHNDEDWAITLDDFRSKLVGTGVVVSSSNVGRNYSVLTVWHVAKVGDLRVLMFNNCPNGDGIAWRGDPSNIACNHNLDVECWGPITVLSIEGVQNITNTGNIRKLSLRKVLVGGEVQAIGYPNGEPTNLGLKVESYQTIKFGGEVLRYMILAPVDFEYFPPKLGGMSGAPVYDKDLRVVALISLEMRSDLLKKDRIAAVPIGEGLGRCRSSVIGR